MVDGVLVVVEVVVDVVVEVMFVVVRDFHNETAGLSKEGGACTAGENAGFISLLNNQESHNLNQSVITLAHQLAHSLGAKQDDNEEVSIRCEGKM